MHVAPSKKPTGYLLEVFVRCVPLVAPLFLTSPLSLKKAVIFNHVPLVSSRDPSNILHLYFFKYPK